MNVQSVSPELRSIDLLRMDVESMQLDELTNHIEELREVLLGLVESTLLRPHISLDAAMNIERQRAKMQLRLSCALDRACDLQVAAAWLDAARQERERAGSDCRPPRLDH